MPKQFNRHDAFIIIDMQNDFMPDGTLPVPEGDKIVPVLNLLQQKFPIVIATRDWHPPHHSSFHTLWPVHCVQNTAGAALVSTLNKENISIIIDKGSDIDIDSYSAFFDNQHQKKTLLDDYLRDNNIHAVYFSGVATDYCVKFSVLDALSLGYEAYVIQDACCGINLQPDDSQKAFFAMAQAGAHMIHSQALLA